MPIRKIRKTLGPTLIISLMLAACGSSTTTTTTEGFLLSERRAAMGVDAACLDLTDEFLLAMQRQVDLLGDLTFAQWVSNGLFYIEDESPEHATRFEEIAAGFESNDCPTGYLSATILAHADRFELRSPGAAIWWAGIVGPSVGTIGVEAEDEDQRSAWLALAGANEQDISSRAVVPDLGEIDAISDCQALAVAANDLFQQQLYLISSVPFLEAAGDVLAPLEPATERIGQLMDIGECDQPVRESLLRRAHEIEFTGPAATASFATEIDAAWGFWVDEVLAPELELEVNVTNQEAGTVEVVLTNVGNLRVRIISIQVDTVLRDELRMSLDPGDGDRVEVTLEKVPVGAIALEVRLQAPTGATQSLSASVPLE